MRYLVVRTDAIRSQRRAHQIDSSCFPIEVDLDISEADHGSESEVYEWIVRKAFDQINKDYVGMHTYLVIPLGGAKLVRFKPRQSYDVSVRHYDG